MSKAFFREELISSSELKEISKKKLFDELLSAVHKLGLVHNNELRAVILDIKTYEQMVDRLEELENLCEDMNLAEELKERVRISGSEWIEKPPHLSRLDFFKQSLKEKGSPL
ncbi:hypothetical protein ACFO25_04740 [Paenactinomyces guangxiensis]|uniref:Antitoxin n=1 Tax=Paenactinomyces guangxiensis TaxID=1490290 RepID=A0A7W2A7L1_9BACL|nr:hypothetical protein [Paenactinomyces guangxiensis]MBA4493685.1 hypothetical protein [Paenactinomyces guangxiensis]MBH8590972.1 hypothetical protein [Paenactinomyces guangxiensis]